MISKDKNDSSSSCTEGCDLDDQSVIKVKDQAVPTRITEDGALEVEPTEGSPLMAVILPPGTYTVQFGDEEVSSLLLIFIIMSSKLTDGGVPGRS